MPFDFDVDNSTTPSPDITGAGTQNFGGGVTFRGVTEADPHPGTGCGFPPPFPFNSQNTQSCNIDGMTDGCLFDVVGGAGAFRLDSSGDIAAIQGDWRNGLPEPQLRERLLATRRHIDDQL